jgi:hypothetical protein
MIEIQTSADFANQILNHPAVRPDVADPAEGPIDIAPIVSNPAHLVLGGEYGVTVWLKYYEGCWEVHTAILPEGRGEWAKKFAEASLQHMFTATDCVEVVTRVPQGHLPARTLTLSCGFHEHFVTPPECLFRGGRVSATIYILSLQDWAMRNPVMLETGAAFHKWMNSVLKGGEPHLPDEAHNRVVGSAIEMVRAGQHRKGVIWYNRWAVAARHAQIALIEEKPVRIKFDAGILTFAEDTFSIERAH